MSLAQDEERPASPSRSPAAGPSEDQAAQNASGSHTNSRPASPLQFPPEPLHSVPPISMSAGADPWADPTPYAPEHETAMHSSRPAARENPWAAAGEEDNDDDDAFGRDASSILGRQTGGASQKGGEALPTDAARPRLAKAISGEIPAREPTAEQRHSLVADERWGEYDLPKFGKSLARYWEFRPGFVNLNSGSFGTCPKPVMDAFKALEDRQEEWCDLFRHKHMSEMLLEARGRVAKVLHTTADQISFITNATTGTNAVLRDLVYASGDVILTFSTTYPAVVFSNIQYLIDTEKMRGVDLSVEAVDIPPCVSDEDVISLLNAEIEKLDKAGKRIRIAVIDSVASRPAIRYPWERMVRLLREKQILSLVDAAHGIGHVPINLAEADPDFFVSNCHKWMYAHRSCAVLYVPHRNRHIQRSSLPTSFGYMSEPTAEKNTWIQQWASPGTLDMAPFLSVVAALDFREKLGGEARILNYNHDLAVRGGKEAARILGTDVFDPTATGEQTAAMTDVRLPIISSRIMGKGSKPEGEKSGKTAPETDLTAATAKWMQNADAWFFDTLMTEFKTSIPVHAYAGKVWARFSAQAWLDMDDFVYGARALRQLCERINQGAAPDFAASRL